MGKLVKKTDYEFMHEDDFIWTHDPDAFAVISFELPASMRYDFKKFVENSCEGDVLYILDTYDDAVVFLGSEEATAFVLAFPTVNKDYVMSYRRYLEENC